MRRARVRRIVSAAVFATVVGAAPLRAQAPRAAGPPPQQPAATGVISGVIVDAATNAPLRLAHVVLIGATTGTLKVTSTEDDGRFLFANLPVDRYTIGASKPPYLGALAGAKRPARPGTSIAVAAGQRVNDVIVRLPPGAAISGTIVDDRGQPAIRTLVGLRTWQMRGADRVVVNAQAPMAATDEAGRYRIAGLPPGEYIVTALTTGLAPSSSRALTAAEVDAALREGAAVAPTPAVSPTIPVERYAPSYYPGTARAEDAAVVTLSTGEDRPNIDFRVLRARTAKIEGTVYGADGGPFAGDGRPASRLTMRTASADAGYMTQMSAPINSDGTFSIAGAVPGTYIATFSVPSGEHLAALVEVAGADITGLQFHLRPPISARGRLAFQGALAPPPANRRIAITPVGADAQSLAPTVSATAADGTFEIARLLPGRYKVGGQLGFGASADQLKWALQSVVVDGRDITDQPFDVSADAPPKEIVVTYTDRWQEISGRMTAGGAPATDYSVVIFPADRSYWIYESRRIAVARPGTNGQFTFGGQGPTTLPPGNYLIAAVTDIERGEQFNPAFLTALAAQAIPVTIAAGERKTQDIAVR